MRRTNLAPHITAHFWLLAALCLGIAALNVWLAGTAIAQDRAQPEDPDATIAASTAELRSRGQTPEFRSTGFSNRGLAYFFKGQYDQAIKDFDQAIRLDPKNLTARQRRGNAKLAKGDIAGAKADLGPTTPESARSIRRPVPTMRLPCGTDCSYHGEVSRDSGVRSTCGFWPRCPYCSGGYCAHGYGWLGNDWSVEFEGNFANGLPDGHGHLTTDFFDYFGGFERGKFHGRGILTCLGPRRYTFELVDGKDVKSGVSALGWGFSSTSRLCPD